MHISLFHLLCILQGVGIFLGYAKPAEADGIAAIMWIPFIMSFFTIFLIGGVIRREYGENEPEAMPEVAFFLLAGGIAMAGIWTLFEAVFAPNAESMELSFRRSVAADAAAALMYVVSYISVIKSAGGERPWSRGGLFAIRILAMVSFAIGIIGFTTGPGVLGCIGIGLFTCGMFPLVAAILLFARSAILGYAKNRMHAT